MENKSSCITINCGCCGDGTGGTEPVSDNIYSTEETICGKWIDGKPIYRKVIPGVVENASGNAYVFANVSELEIDRLINLYGSMIDNIECQIMLQTSYNRVEVLSSAVTMCYDNQTKNIYYHFLNNNGQSSGCTAYAVLEYTRC